MFLAGLTNTNHLGRYLENLPAALASAVERGLERATELLRTAAAGMARSPFGARVPGGLGEFAESVRGEVNHGRDRQTGHVFLAPPADAYGIFVEAGSAPHFPPPGALDGWVRRRLGVSDEKQVREIAFLIGRKISRQGTAGRHIFERTLIENEERVMGILEEEVARALEAA